jgi:DNA (cytosine-5)-methyltransferase 1
MKALDLFCGAGGAAMGLRLAGFNCIVGIDIMAQPEYPFEFICGDVFDVVDELEEGKTVDSIKSFDLIWASPPCQEYLFATKKHRNLGKKYPDLINETRHLLGNLMKPFVIENVCTAPIRKDLILNGMMFNLGTIRYRAFEIWGFDVSPPLWNPKNGTVKEGKYITVAGHGGEGSARLADWQWAMGIDWITDKKMLAEAVPPVYAKYIGEAFLNALKK